MIGIVLVIGFGIGLFVYVWGALTFGLPATVVLARGTDPPAVTMTKSVTTILIMLLWPIALGALLLHDRLRYQHWIVG